MRMLTILVWSLLALPLVALAEDVTTETLIREMVDLDRLGDFPNPEYRTLQFSSHDRRSVRPDESEWYANADGFGKEPLPNFEDILDEPDVNGVGRYLICDVTGPGAIVRTWTARITGEIRVYLDSLREPLYEGPAEAFLLRPYDIWAGEAGLEPEVLEGALYEQNAAYCPLPFARRCRIEWVGNPNETHFYEIQLRHYTRDTKVTTFTPSDLAEHKHVIRDVAKRMVRPDDFWVYAPGQPIPALDVTLAPKEMKDAVSIEVPGAIQRLELHIDAEDMRAALRQTLLHIRFDDAPWGQVQSPVGDFFGAAPDINPFVSVPFTVQPDGTMVCRFVMPYARRAVIGFENKGEQAVRITGSVRHADRPWNPDTAMYFRARWRVDHDLVGSGNAVQGVQDLPFLMAFGQGVYVGTTSILMNPNEVPSSGGNWWGEGDEKIYVDDDKKPSTFGTGSEDYFNYAWSSTDLFLFPYCGQPRNDGPANRGFVTNFRWHILDPLPFTDRIAFFMELFTHEVTRGMSYARIAYHYGRPGLVDEHVPITGEDVRKPQLPPAWNPASRGGAHDSVFIEPETAVEGNAPHRVERDAQWSGGACWVWEPGAVGDTLSIALNVETAGKYRIKLVGRLADDGGAFTAQLDDTKLLPGNADTFDLKVEHRVLSRELRLGDLSLEPGEHVLTLTAVRPGAVGIDFLWIQKD